MNAVCEKKGYLPALGGLRALAFLAVYAFHCGAAPTGPFAVSIFLILSGFCMYYRYGDRIPEPGIKGNVLFAWVRLRKLYVLHVFLLLFLLIEGMVTGLMPDTSLPALCSNFLLLMPWLPASWNIPIYNDVSWYLAAAFLAYLLFPFLAERVNTIQGTRNLMLALAAGYACQLLIIGLGRFIFPQSTDNRVWLSYHFPPSRILDFFLGCLLAKLYLIKGAHQKASGKAGWAELMICGFCVVTMLIYVLKRGFLGSPEVRRVFLLTPGALLLVYGAAQNQGVLSRLLCSKWLSVIGKFSGTAFLTHHILIRITRVLLFGNGSWGPYWHKLTVAAAAFLPTMLLSWLYESVYKRRKT